MNEVNQATDQTTKFNRLIIAIQRTAFTDLNQLEKYVDEHDENGLSDALQAAGLIYLSTYDGGSIDTGENSSKFKINQNGYLLLRYGLLKKDVDGRPRLTVINVDPYWETPVDKRIAQMNDDRAMLDFDIARGK